MSEETQTTIENLRVQRDLVCHAAQAMCKGIHAVLPRLRRKARAGVEAQLAEIKTLTAMILCGNEEGSIPAKLAAEDVVQMLHASQQDQLAEWARLASRNTISAGGIGQTAEEQKVAACAWSALDPFTQNANHLLVRLARRDYLYALQNAPLRPECDEEAHPTEPTDRSTPLDVEAILTNDYPSLPFLSAAQWRSVAAAEDQATPEEPGKPDLLVRLDEALYRISGGAADALLDGRVEIGQGDDTHRGMREVLAMRDELAEAIVVDDVKHRINRSLVEAGSRMARKTVKLQHVVRTMLEKLGKLQEITENPQWPLTHRSYIKAWIEKTVQECQEAAGQEEQAPEGGGGG